jgi:intraflagellar transport protein 20
MDFENVQISFDEEFKLRVLDADKFKQTEELEKECTGFVTKIQEFNDTVHTLVGIMDTQAQKIEKWKLKVRCSYF